MAKNRTMSDSSDAAMPRVTSAALDESAASSSSGPHEQEALTCILRKKVRQSFIHDKARFSFTSIILIRERPRSFFSCASTASRLQ